MSSPQGSFIPILIIAMVTWKISGSKRTAEIKSASSRHRSGASSRNFRKDSAGSISERLYARDMKQARPAARSSLSNAKRILNKSETRHSKSLAQADERERRDRRT